MIKKFIAVGDIHGRDVWKKININKYEKIIFAGDYVDGPLSDGEVIKNLQEIIQLKRDNEDKVILLAGNHDIQYMFWDVTVPFQCSGYRPNIQHILTALFNEIPEYFQAAYQIDNFLFTHAGITNGWYNYCKEIIEEYQNKFKTKTLADTLNLIFRSKDMRILHLVSYHGNRGGWSSYGGITWADRTETINDPLDGYHQIVGHTPRRTIETHWKSEVTKITYIDVLGSEVAFYEYPVTFDLK